MLTNERFLLINGSEDRAWHRAVVQALEPLGELQFGREENAIKLILENDYDLILVDAAAVENVPLLVARIRAQQSMARIVVATASPTWRRARDAFQAGAIDYIVKTPDKDEISITVYALLEKRPIPRPL